MMAGAGGVRLPFVGVGEPAAVEEVVARCRMEGGLVLRAGGDASGWWRRGWSYYEKQRGADSQNSNTKTILGE
jgi:hypothetical protein